ncbi:MAG: type IV pilus twitching motility protein PilT [Armatimonadota bacterium]
MALEQSLDDLLVMLRDADGSDLHLRVGEPPVIRVYGTLQRTDLPVLTDEDVERLMFGIIPPEKREHYERNWEMDMAYELEGVARFRVNCYRQQGHLGAALRLIPVEIESIDDLGLPQVLKNVAMLPRGLCLVTGPTGSGKSTTLAAMVDHINDHKRAHIITIEDPIEFVHRDKRAAINQREVGADTHSFAHALRHVLRQNPDTILVGEMRDLETISLAITAAETGHLVFATLHTTDAMQTVDRAIDVFPPQQQQQIRMQLAVTLECVVCQSLLPRKDGNGRIAAFEIMLATPAIRALIREGKTHQIYNSIQSGQEHGMIVLDQFLANLVREGYVDFEEALAKSSYPAELARRCGVDLEAFEQAQVASAAPAEA